MDYILKSSDERVVINDFVQGDPLSEENLDKTLELVSNLRKFDSANPCKMGVSEVKNSDEIRLSFPNKSIWIYTGYTWKSIFGDYTHDIYNNSKRRENIRKCNIMIDGQYVDSKRDVLLKWRGSSNQMVIDVQKTLQIGEIVLHCD